MRRVWTVARREVGALFDQATGYILLVVFLVVTNFLFFRQAFLVSAASMRPMFDFLPWTLLFLVPAVTMRTLAEDQRSGTLEVVLAQPLTEAEFLLGKYLGAVLVVWLALLCTVLVPLGLSLGADMQTGIVVAQYTGGALLSAGLVGVGVWASSLTRNQITAFIIAVAVMFVLVLVGLNPLVVGLPPTLGTIAARLGVLSHFTNIARGVIDLRDAIYFVSLAVVFLLLAYGALLGRKLSRTGTALRRLRAGVAVLVVAMVFVNLLGGYLGGRLDLTPGRAYTLTGATKRLLADLDDLVTIRLFASKELPSEVSLVKRDLDDMLSDYRSAGRGNVRVIERDPGGDEDVRTEAQSLGIPAIQFNVIGQAELQVKEGYLGLAVQYADGVETIPFVRRTDDLEYRLSSAVRSLTRTAKPAVGLAVPTDFSGGRTYNQLRDELGKTYEVRTLTLSDSTQPAADLQALVLIGGDTVSGDQIERLRAYVMGGGGALVAAAGMELSQQGPFASAVPVAWNAILEPFGLSIRSDMVYDLASNERVSMPTQFGRLLMPYPYWLRALSTREATVNAEVGSLFLPWASSLDTAGAVPGTVTPLFLTTEQGGIAAEPVFLDPNGTFPSDSLSERLVAALATGAEDTTAGPSGRVAVVGNAEFLVDRYVQSAPENLIFALNAVDWLAQDPALIAIRSRDRTPPPLAFTSATTRDVVRYGNLIAVPVLVVLAAIARMIRRKRISGQTYRPREAGAT
jgi:ABC-2 type transport system permease protein